MGVLPFAGNTLSAVHSVLSKAYRSVLKYWPRLEWSASPYFSKLEANSSLTWTASVTLSQHLLLLQLFITNLPQLLPSFAGPLPHTHLSWLFHPESTSKRWQAAQHARLICPTRHASVSPRTNVCEVRVGWGCLFGAPGYAHVRDGLWRYSEGSREESQGGSGESWTR